MSLALLLTAFAIGGIACGVWLGHGRGLSPRIAAAGGGLLFGISLFWMLPEMAEHSGWLFSFIALCIGLAALWAIDHFVHPICPSCSHNHDHAHCGAPPLHGFAAPLLIASGIHSLLDGWSVVLLNGRGMPGLAILLGLGLHKIPEGLGLGLIARKSMSSSYRAFFACAAAECLTIFGAWIEPQADHAALTRFGPAWSTAVLALIGGSFLFLGFHVVHGSRHRTGVVPTFFLTLAAVGCAAAVHWHLGGI